MGFVEPKVLVPLRRRDKRYKRLKRRKERFRQHFARMVYTDYYESKKE